MDDISQCKYACLTEETRVSAFAGAMWMVYACITMLALLLKFLCGLVYVGCLLLLRLLDSEFKCAHQTRLETRTKESNMYASRRVENLKAQ